MTDPVSVTQEEKPAWRCYHCGDVFTDDRCARLHFGRDEDSTPACQIKAGAEQGLLGALRDAEYAAADAQAAIANECTEAARAYYAQATRHNQALRNAEELGYERGLADARPTPDTRPAAAGSVRESGEVYRHKKRNTAYIVIGEAELQTATGDLVDGSALVVYQGVDGKMWAREEGEFHDGRFERLFTAAPTPKAAASEAGEVTGAENAQVAVIDAIFAENINEQASRLGVHPVETESPGWWQQRVRKAAVIAALTTQGGGEG